MIVCCKSRIFFDAKRMNTVQRDVISSPAIGLVIFNTNCNDLHLFNGDGWAPVGNSGIVAAPSETSGMIDDPYQWRKDLVAKHVHRRRVKWLQVFPEPIDNRKINAGKNLSQATMFELSSITFPDI